MPAGLQLHCSHSGKLKKPMRHSSHLTPWKFLRHWHWPSRWRQNVLSEPIPWQPQATGKKERAERADTMASASYRGKKNVLSEPIPWQAQATGKKDRTCWASRYHGTASYRGKRQNLLSETIPWQPQATRKKTTCWASRYHGNRKLQGKTTERAERADTMASASYRGKKNVLSEPIPWQAQATGKKDRTCWASRYHGTASYRGKRQNLLSETIPWQPQATRKKTTCWASRYHGNRKLQGKTTERAERADTMATAGKLKKKRPLTFTLGVTIVARRGAAGAFWATESGLAFTATPPVTILGRCASRTAVTTWREAWAKPLFNCPFHTHVFRVTRLTWRLKNAHTWLCVHVCSRPKLTWVVRKYRVPERHLWHVWTTMSALHKRVPKLTWVNVTWKTRTRERECTSLLHAPVYSSKGICNSPGDTIVI